MAIINDLWSMFGNKDESNIKKTVKATVLRKDEDGRIWVHIEGGVDETPIYSTTASVSAGDVVNVRIEGGKAYIDGSTSSPSVGVQQVTKIIKPVADSVEEAKQSARTANEASDASKRAAEEARSAAAATSQHFWFREEDTQSDGAGTGAFVTDETKADFLEAAASGFPSKSDSKPYHNLLMNSLGIMLRTALNNLVSITQSSIAFFDGLGNEAKNVVASFGKDGALIGAQNTTRILINPTHITGRSKYDETYFSISMDNYGDVTILAQAKSTTSFGSYNQTVYLSDLYWIEVPSEDPVDAWPPQQDDVYITCQTFINSTVKMFFTVYYGVPTDGWVTVDLGRYRYDGSNTLEVFANESMSSSSTVFAMKRPKSYPKFIFGSGTANNQYALSEGNNTTASGNSSHAEGIDTTAFGYASHAEGFITTASGNFSHAEGDSTTASAAQSHAEGNYTTASSTHSHAEGNYTTASGIASHAEGYQTIASGHESHAEGYYSTASGNYSHAQNYYTRALSANQTAIGKYNVEDNSDAYALIIGNGTADDARSNALTVGWNGNTTIYGQNIAHTHLDIVSPLMKRGENPAQNTWAGLQFCGSDGGRFAFLEASKTPDGGHLFYMTLLDDTTAQNGYGGFRLEKPHGTTGANLLTFRVDTGWLYVPSTIQVAGLTQYKGHAIEFYPPANNSGYGGFIDFHYNQSTADYTSRIWETASGRIQVLGAGNFEKRGAGSGNGIWTIATDMTRDEQRSATQDAPAFVIGDTSYNTMGRMCVRHESGNDKNHWNMIEINRVVNGTSIWNSIAVGIDKNGSQKYFVGNPSAFRNAIGEAGTVQATLASAYVHTDYGGLTCVRKGDIVFYNVNLHVKAFSGRKQIATVPAGYRPSVALYAFSTTGGYVTISTGGDVQYDGGSDKYLYCTTTGIRA